MSRIKKTNIAYFTYNLNSYSGAAQQALSLAKNLPNDYKIYIFNFDTTPTDFNLKLIHKNIFKIDLPKSIFKQFLLISKISLKEKISIFHLHVLNYFVIVIGYFLRKKVILKTTMMGSDDFNSKKNSKFGYLKLRIIKLIDINIALTNIIKESNSKFIDFNRIEKIPNGVVINNNINNNLKSNIFVFIGLVCERKATYKSIEYFINHYSKIKESKLYIIGPNSKKDGIEEFDPEYYQKCLNLIKIHQMTDKIIFTGLLDKNIIREILIKTKVLLFFSNKEGMPNVVIETMAYNCVPITSPIDGAAKEIFDDRMNGFILNDLNDRVSIDDINKMILNNSPYNKVKEKFDLMNISLKYAKLYSSLIKKSNKC